MGQYISTIGFRPPPQPSILIVTPDRQAGATLAAQVQKALFRTRCAPEERLDRMLTAELPDIVVVDCGAAGAAVCETIKRERPLLPVVVAVGEADRLPAIKAGADHCMSTPIAADELVARARALVDVAGRQAALTSKLEALRMWHDWVRYLVHDLRQSVTVAMGTVSIARDRNADVEVERDLHEAGRALDEMSMMLRDILDTDRIKHGVLAPQKEVVDVAELATAVVGTLALDHQVDVTGDGDTTIVADPFLLGRVFSNLVLNASRYAKERPIHVEVSGGPHGISARVINDGPGIGPELEAQLFEPWRKVEQGGSGATGIGLAFCRLVCEAHEGKIWLEDATAGKVTFAFGIPRPQPTTEGPPP